MLLKPIQKHKECQGLLYLVQIEVVPALLKWIAPPSVIVLLRNNLDCSQESSLIMCKVYLNYQARTNNPWCGIPF